MEAFEFHVRGANIALMFHGLYCLLIGFLVFRSTFLPRILGMLMAMGGLAWLTDSSIPLTNHLAPYQEKSVSTTEIMKRIAGASPCFEARIVGLLYLVIFIAAPSGAATATPTKMIVTLACDASVGIILYDLLKPVNKSISLLAVFFRLIFVAVMAVNSLSYFGAVVLDQNAPNSPAAFNTGYCIAMVPFGLHCLPIGYLISRSIFLPRILGILMALAGLGYLTFLWPRLGSHLFFPWIVIPGVVGEASLTLWFLVIGVNVRRWKQQSNALTAHG